MGINIDRRITEWDREPRKKTISPCPFNIWQRRKRYIRKIRSFQQMVLAKLDSAGEHIDSRSFTLHKNSFKMDQKPNLKPDTKNPRKQGIQIRILSWTRTYKLGRIPRVQELSQVSRAGTT